MIEVGGDLLLDDEADAVRIANDSEYGLAGSVWTSDLDRGTNIARRVRTGVYTVNGFMMEFGSPFGGFKESGIGRLNGVEAIDQFLQTKSVWLELGEEIQDPFVLKV